MFGLRSWLNRRKIDGSLNRTPLGFYDRVWQILERTPNGILVAGTHLPQVTAPLRSALLARFNAAAEFWTRSVSRLPEDSESCCRPPAAVSPEPESQLLPPERSNVHFP